MYSADRNSVVWMKPNYGIASHLGQLLWLHASTSASSSCGAERLRELYVLGDFPRDEHMAARAGKLAELAELEKELGGADYPLEAALTHFNRMGEILRDGSHKQQKRAINLLFDKILVRAATGIRGVELQN